jgi:hypothetical protein
MEPHSHFGSRGRGPNWPRLAVTLKVSDVSSTSVSNSESEFGGIQIDAQERVVEQYVEKLLRRCCFALTTTRSSRPSKTIRCSSSPPLVTKRTPTSQRKQTGSLTRLIDWHRGSFSLPTHPLRALCVSSSAPPSRSSVFQARHRRAGSPGDHSDDARLPSTTVITC